MRHLEAGLDALINAGVEAALAGFERLATAQEEVRARGSELREHAAAAALLGPKLADLANKLTGEVERRTAVRYASILAHPRFVREQLIDELTDAEVTMNVAMTDADQPPTTQQLLAMTLATVRVRAITIALDGRAFAGPRQTKGSGGPTPRRRDVSAADIEPAIADQLFELAAHRGDWRDRLTPLVALERMPINRSGLVTKLLALFEGRDGRAHLDHIVMRLNRALGRGEQAQVPVRAAAQRLPPSSESKTEVLGLFSSGEGSAPSTNGRLGIAARIAANRTREG